MQIKKYWLILLVAICCFPIHNNQAQANTEITPFQEVKTTIDLLVEAVGQFPGNENIQARRAKLRKIIEPRFDFREMAKRSLGTHWTEISPQEQEDFVAVFSDLLATTYLKRIENIQANTVKIESEKLSLPTSLVKTMVTHKGDKFPIDYKLVKRDSWKVYDVVIENIGLVANYRNEFAGIIRKEQFSGLMKRLRNKAAES